MTECPDVSARPLKVLHVDDDPMNLRVVQEILGDMNWEDFSAYKPRDDKRSDKDRKMDGAEVFLISGCVFLLKKFFAVPTTPVELK